MRDDDTLHFTRALVNLSHLRIAEQSFNGIVTHISVPTKNLNRTSEVQRIVIARELYSDHDYRRD